jgi:hypothetical protein
MSSVTSDIFTNDQKTLIQVSKYLKILAYFLLIFNLIRFVLGILDLTTFVPHGESLISTFTNQSPDILLEILYSTLYPLFQGIVWFILLIGVSLGIKMIVQTDLNYRSDKGGGNGK